MEAASWQLRNWGCKYQQKPNSRILLPPFINGSHAQKVRLLDFWPSKATIYFSGRNLEKTYNEKIQFIFLSKEFLNDVSDDSNTKLHPPDQTLRKLRNLRKLRKNLKVARYFHKV